MARIGSEREWLRRGGLRLARHVRRAVRGDRHDRRALAGRVASAGEPGPEPGAGHRAGSGRRHRAPAQGRRRVPRRRASGRPSRRWWRCSTPMPSFESTRADSPPRPGCRWWVRPRRHGRCSRRRPGTHRSASLRHSLGALRQVLDHAGVEPNPARDRVVRLPHEVGAEVQPPSADHVERALGAVARRYRLPLLVLEATAMRVGELESLTWSDVEEPAGRWRVHKATAKTRKSRWVQVPVDLFAAITALCPRGSRSRWTGVRGRRPGAAAHRPRPGLQGDGDPRFGVHDLRQRRLSLWHRDGVPGAEAAKRAGHARSSLTLDACSHVLVDDREVDRAAFLKRRPGAVPGVSPRGPNMPVSRVGPSPARRIEAP